MDHDSMLPFAWSTRALAALMEGVRDDQLADPTPCPAWTVGDLAHHVVGLTAAFTAAARKDPRDAGAAPTADAGRLPDGWREAVGDRLADLADAWADPSAYDGTTMAGPVEMPGSAAGLVALDEVVVHAWDLAVATGQSYEADPAAVEAVSAFVASFEPPEDGAADDGGLFGPPVDVSADAPALDRLVGRTGRDPGWAGAAS